jgi:hypothetical protein
MNEHFRELFSGHNSLMALITHRFDRLERIMAETQAQLDALVSQINTGVSDITNEIAALKDQPAGQDLDFSGLDSAVQGLQTLDTSNTTAQPTFPPVDTDPTA